MRQRTWKLAAAVVLAVAIAALLAPASSGAQIDPDGPGLYEISADEIAYWAAEWSTTAAEAERRLAQHHFSGLLLSTATAADAAAFGGLWFDDSKPSRINLAYTDAAATITAAVAIAMAGGGRALRDV